MVWGDMPADGKCAHTNDNMSCIACHSAWNPSCFGCHLPQRANIKAPMLHGEGDTQRNYTAYNFQTLRDDVFVLARDGDVAKNKINPARGRVVRSTSARKTATAKASTSSSKPSPADGYGGIAFS